MDEVYHGEPVPTMEELLRRVSYLFVDTHPLLDFARPVPSQVYSFFILNVIKCNLKYNLKCN
jgi:hypothetical protein